MRKIKGRFLTICALCLATVTCMVAGVFAALDKETRTTVAKAESVEVMNDNWTATPTYGNVYRYVSAQNNEISFEKGASIRYITDNNADSGIRFTANVDTEIANVATEVGMLIVPETYISDYNASDYTDYFTYFETVKRKTKNSISATFDKEQIASGTIKGCIVGIKDANWNRSYQAVTYYIANGEYYYSSPSDARTIAYVADKAVTDTEKDYSENLRNSLAAIVKKSIDAKYSSTADVSGGINQTVDLNALFNYGLSGTTTWSIVSGASVTLDGATANIQEDGETVLRFSAYDGRLTKDVTLNVDCTSQPITVKYIATADDFMAISKDLTGNYELTCDIDMSEKEWTVLGEFSGHLNGNGYTVKNINYTKQASGFGIFQKVLSQGIVERLGVTGYVADAGDWAGVICVENYGTIRNCWTNVVLKSESACGYAGLIALKNMGNGVIENCYTIGANLGMGTEYSLSKGVLLLEKEQTAHENNVFVLADNNEFTLAIGNTASSSSMLKTLAEMEQASLYSAWDTSIWNIQDGQLPALKTDSGARLTQSEVYIVNTKNSYSVSELSGATIQVKVAAIDCDFGDLSYAIKEQGSNVTVSGAGVVTLPETITSDLLFTVVVSLNENVSAEMTFTVSVPKNVVKISTAEQLLAIDGDLNGNYELIADIDLTGKTWTPLAAAKLNPGVVGDYTTKGFSGTFNGNGHTIKNFSFTPQWNGFALFNKINASAVVENVCIEATINDAGSWIGGITGDNYGIIRNCLVKVTLKGSNNDSYAGGICCNNKTGGVIENCVVLGSIETTPSAYADVSNGAFAVENQGMITQCFALNTVTTYAVGKASGLGNLSSQTDGLKTEDEMKSVATYAEYDTDIWNIVAGEYPSLKSVDEN